MGVERVEPRKAEAARCARCDNGVTPPEKHLHLAGENGPDNSVHDGAESQRPTVRKAPCATPEELREVLAHTATDVPTGGYCMGLSRAASYRAAKNGSLPTIRVSGRLVVPTSALARMLGVEMEP